MRNPFKKFPVKSVVLGTQKLLQWTTIAEIDRLLNAFNIEYSALSFADGDMMARCSTKVETVLLSQWAVASGIALSKAAGNPTRRQQVQECYDRLKADIQELFIGLNNGVSVGNSRIISRSWISDDGNAAPAYRYFQTNYASRFAEYASLFAGAKAFDEALNSVINKAVPRIFDASRQPNLQAEFGDPQLPAGGVSEIYQVVRSGIGKFVQAEIEETIRLVDG